MTENNESQEAVSDECKRKPTSARRSATGAAAPRPAQHLVHLEVASPYDQDKFVGVRVPWELTGKEIACGVALARTALEVATGKYRFARYMLTPVSVFAIDVLAKCTVVSGATSGAPDLEELRSRVIGLTLASKYLFQEVEPALQTDRQLLVSVMRGMAKELFQKGGEHSLKFICERLSADGYPYAPKRAKQIAALFASELKVLTSVAELAAEAAVIATAEESETKTKEEETTAKEDKRAVTVTLEATKTPAPAPTIVVVPAVPTPLAESGGEEHGCDAACEETCPIEAPADAHVEPESATPTKKPHLDEDGGETASTTIPDNNNNA